MSLEKYEIKPKNEILIKIIYRQRKKIYQKKLKITSSLSNPSGEFEIKTLTVSLEILLSWENYELLYKNRIYHLKAYQLFSKGKFTFRIQNYLKGEENIIKEKFEDLGGNASEKLDLKDEILL